MNKLIEKIKDISTNIDGIEVVTLSGVIEIIQEETKAYNDCILVHTQGLDEGIYCAMCTNSIKSDRGCDGGCIVNKDMYQKVLDVIKHQTEEVKAYKPQTNADYIRSLSDEELAKAMARNIYCDKCEIRPYCHKHIGTYNCVDVFLDWLQAERQG